MSAILMAGALAAGCALSQPRGRNEAISLETVQQVDLERYAGLWYEIARYPNWFERGCAGVTAEYARRPDGLISVRNTCRRPGEAPDVAQGRARVTPGSVNARLRVSFAPEWLPLFWGDYWILYVDANYQTALVGDPSGGYLWLLARTPHIDAQARQRLEAAAIRNGYDPARLEETVQPPMN